MHTETHLQAYMCECALANMHTDTHVHIHTYMHTHIFFVQSISKFIFFHILILLSFMRDN